MIVLLDVVAVLVAVVDALNGLLLSSGAVGVGKVKSLNVFRAGDVVWLVVAFCFDVDEVLFDDGRFEPESFF